MELQIHCSTNPPQKGDPAVPDSGRLEDRISALVPSLPPTAAIARMAYQRLVPLRALLVFLAIPFCFSVHTVIGQSTAGKKLAILNQMVLREYPIVRFRFNATVPVAPVVYLSQRKIDGYHIDPKLIAASKTGPVGTAHDIRIALPKGERTYYFVVNVDGKPIWIDTVVQSSPKTF
jgi:hypothetical protein